MMDLSIIIVNWNTKNYLENCLESVFTNKAELKFEVIVVDNASTDGSPEMVEQKFPQVRLIRNNSNLGFARANNIAFPIAQGEHVLLLNSDTKVLSGLLDFAVRRLKEDNQIGAVAPRIYNSDGTVQHPCYVSYPSFFSELVDSFYLTQFIRNYNRFGKFTAADKVSRSVIHATGACLFVRRSLLNVVGYLDDSLIFSYEDADLCRRLRSIGYSIVYVPQAEVIHYGSASTGKLLDKGVEIVFTSKYRYFKKHHGRSYVYSLAIVIVSSALAKLVIASLLEKARASNHAQRTRKVSKYYWDVLRWHFSTQGRKIIGY